MQGTFRERLRQAAGGTLEAYQTTILEQLRQVDPLTNQTNDHDMWWELSLVWLRIHYVSRNALFVPEDEQFVRGLAVGRMTSRVDVDGNVTRLEDTCRAAGSQPGGFAFTGGTLFEKPGFPLEAEPENTGDLLAQRPRGLPEPTDLERQEHRLTHLSCRSWCPARVQAKSRQNQSRTLSLKQPVMQLGFSFLSDEAGGLQITLLDALAVLSGLGLTLRLNFDVS